MPGSLFSSVIAHVNARHQRQHEIPYVTPGPLGLIDKVVMFLYIHFSSFLSYRKVTLVMVGLDNAGKTATVRGIQGG